MAHLLLQKGAPPADWVEFQPPCESCLQIRGAVNPEVGLWLAGSLVQGPQGSQHVVGQWFLIQALMLERARLAVQTLSWGAVPQVRSFCCARASLVARVFSYPVLHMSMSRLVFLPSLYPVLPLRAGSSHEAPPGLDPHPPASPTSPPS